MTTLIMIAPNPWSFEVATSSRRGGAEMAVTLATAYRPRPQADPRRPATIALAAIGSMLLLSLLLAANCAEHALLSGHAAFSARHHSPSVSLGTGSNAPRHDQATPRSAKHTDAAPQQTFVSNMSRTGRRRPTAPVPVRVTAAASPYFARAP